MEPVDNITIPVLPMTFAEQQTQAEPISKLFLILLPLSFFLIIENLFTIVLFTHEQYLNTASNILVVSLAVTDFLFAGYWFIRAIIQIAASDGQASFYFYAKVHCLVQIMVQYTCMITSVTHLALIAGYRYLYMIYPRLYMPMVSRRRIKCAVVVTWFTTVLISTLPMLKNRYSGQCQAHYTGPLYFDYFVSAFMLLTMCATLTLYVLLIRAARIRLKSDQLNRVEPLHLGSILPYDARAQSSSQGQTINTETTSVQDDEGVNQSFLRRIRRRSFHRGQHLHGGIIRRQVQMLKMHIIVFGALVVCYLPFITINCLLSLTFYVPNTLIDALWFLLFLNSGVNFFVYLFMNRRFRNAFMRRIGYPLDIPHGSLASHGPRESRLSISFFSR